VAAVNNAAVVTANKLLFKFIRKRSMFSARHTHAPPLDIQILKSGRPDLAARVHETERNHLDCLVVDSRNLRMEQLVVSQQRPAAAQSSVR